jgi:hypothetical protein
MKLDVQWVDIEAMDYSGQPHAVMLPRQLIHGNKPNGGLFNKAEVGRIGKIWVPQAQVVLSGVIYSMTRSGEFVHVPIFLYVPQRSLSGILASGIEIGLRAIHELRRYTQDEVKLVTLVIGNECKDLGTAGGGYACHAGIALWTEI